MERKQVILADDDKWILSDLKELVDWEGLGFEICATVESGEEALRQIERLQPHVLITDIRMMGMNGLDLIDIVRKRYPQIKILIMTSYPEFDYAKRAISSGVMDYMLKTEITDVFLTQKLWKIAESFQNEEQDDRNVSEKKLAEFLSSPEGKEAPEKADLLLRTFKGKKYYFSIFLHSEIFRRGTYLWKDYSGKYLEELKQLVREQAGYYSAAPIVLSVSEFLILGLLLDNSLDHPKNILNDFNQNLMRKRNLLSESYVQFYSPDKMTIPEFKKIYHSSIPMIHFFSIFHTSDVINLQDCIGSRFVPTQAPFPFHELALAEDHMDQNIVLLKNYVQRCYDNCDIYSLHAFFEKFSTHLEISGNGRFAMPDTLYAPSLQQFLQWAYHALLDCIHALKRGEDYQYCSAVKTAIEFMENHYPDYQLSATTIADAAGLSSGRLGILFKNDTGHTLNEYLNHLRVEKAIYLLKNTSLKIYEISDRCGYNSPKYFSKVLQQKTGKRPLDFRRK